MLMFLILTGFHFFWRQPPWSSNWLCVDILKNISCQQKCFNFSPDDLPKPWLRMTCLIQLPQKCWGKNYICTFEGKKNSLGKLNYASLMYQGQCLNWRKIVQVRNKRLLLKFPPLSFIIPHTKNLVSKNAVLLASTCILLPKAFSVIHFCSVILQDDVS